MAKSGFLTKKFIHNFFFNINEKKVNEMLKFNCNIVKMTLRKFIKKKI